MRRKLHGRVKDLSTGVLRVMSRWLVELPDRVMCDLRKAVNDELLARELPLIAEESGGYPCVSIGGVQ